MMHWAGVRAERNYERSCHDALKAIGHVAPTKNTTAPGAARAAPPGDASRA